MFPWGPNLPVSPGALTASLTQSVDGGTDLESGTQFDVHGGDEVVLSQQQQGLSVDFLRQELSRQLFATWPQTWDVRLRTKGTEEEPADVLTCLEARRWTCRLLPRSTQQGSPRGSLTLRFGYKAPGCREEHFARLSSRRAKNLGTAKKSHPPLRRHWTRPQSDWTRSYTVYPQKTPTKRRWR